MLSGLDADLQFLRLGIEQEKTVRFSELHGTFLLKGGSCHAQSVTSGKGLSIGCQFSILLGTYYPRNTIVGSDESCDRTVKSVGSLEFLYVLFNKLDGQSY